MCGPSSATCVTATHLFLHREAYKDGGLNFPYFVDRRPQKPKTARTTKSQVVYPSNAGSLVILSLIFWCISVFVPPFPNSTLDLSATPFHRASILSLSQSRHHIRRTPNPRGRRPTDRPQRLGRRPKPEIPPLRARVTRCPSPTFQSGPRPSRKVSGCI